MASLGHGIFILVGVLLWGSAIWNIFLRESTEIENVAERLGVFLRPSTRKRISRICAGGIIAFNFTICLWFFGLSIPSMFIIQTALFLLSNHVIIPVIFANYGDISLKQVLFVPFRDFIRRHLQSSTPDLDDNTPVRGGGGERLVFEHFARKQQLAHQHSQNENTNQDTSDMTNSNSDTDNHLTNNSGSAIGDGLYGELLGFSGIGAGSGAGATTATDETVVEEPLIARSFTNAVSQSDMDSRRNSTDTITKSVARQRYIDRCLRELEYNRCTMPADEYADAVAAAKAAVGFSDFTDGNPYVVPDEEDDGDDPLDELFTDVEDTDDEYGFEGDDDPYGFNSPRSAPGRMARYYTFDTEDW